jgi:hypothetical protein
VPDFTAPEAFNDVFKNNSFDYVVHTAAPMPRRSGPDLQTDYLDPSIKGYGTGLNPHGKVFTDVSGPGTSLFWKPLSCMDLPRSTSPLRVLLAAQPLILYRLGSVVYLSIRIAGLGYACFHILPMLRWFAS